MRTTLLFVFTAFYLLPFWSKATTYYVSPTGSNTNPGTFSKPWKTPAKVTMTNFNGDTILFQGGSTFSGRMYFTSADIGTSTKPIVIGSYGTGKATIDSDTSFGIYIYNAAGFKIKDLIVKGAGRTINQSSGIFAYMDKETTLLSYLRVENVETYGYKNKGIHIGSWNKKSGFRDVSITNCLAHDNGSAGIAFFAETTYVHKNIYVAYCKTYNNSGIAEQTIGNSGSGILLGNVDGAVVEFCTSYNNGWLHSNTYGGPVGIWAYASNNVIIQKNESHHNKTGSSKDGGGFDLDACSNSIMQYNYSHDNQGAGFILARYSTGPIMKNLIIRYNISENDGRKNDYGGIHLWTAGTIIGIQNAEIYNNTVYMTPQSYASPKAFYIRSGGYSGVKVRNNIFQTTGGVTILRLGSTSGITFQGNDYWPTGSTFKIIWGSTYYSSLTSWRSGTGQEKLDGVATGYQLNPQFYYDVPTGATFSNATQITELQRYKLQSTSGLINKGLNLTSLFGINVGTRDFWGNSLAGKSSFNIGAYQLTTGARPQITITGELENARLTAATLQIFPNPISSNAAVRFGSPTSGKASVMLYNVDGKLLNTLFSGEMKAGDFRNVPLSANELTNGVYIIRLFVGEKVLTNKIVVSK